MFLRLNKFKNKKKICSASINANNSDFLAKLTSLMTSDLTFIKKDKSGEFKNKEAAADERG